MERGASGRAGILDFYRVLWSEAAVTARRVRLDRWVEILLVVAWVALRIADVGRLPMAGWAAVVVLVALAAPRSGFVVLAAIAPFPEGLLFTRDVGLKPVLALVLLAAVGLRVVVDRRSRVWPGWSLVLAGGVILGTGVGLLVSAQRFGIAFALDAFELWFQGPFTAVAALAVAYWVSRDGGLGPLVALLGSATVAGVLSLVDYQFPTLLRNSPLDWVLQGPYVAGRLTGVIRSWVSTAALVMVPATVYLALATLGRGILVRAGSLLLAVPLLATAYFTYNRAVFLGLFALAVVVAWRIRRAFGVVVLVVGLVGGALALPYYLQLRAEAVGGSGAVQPGAPIVASDLARLNAWATSWRMFLDSPLIGHGYRSYRQVAPAFGDTTLNAPHSEWFRLFAENGLVVGLLGLGFAAATAVALARRRDALGTGLLGAWLSFVLAASFNNPFLFNAVTIVAFGVAGVGLAHARLGPSERPPGVEAGRDG
jgi:hypothetical protein